MFLLISLLLLIGSSSSKKRTCGPTRNLDLLSMKPGEKKLHDSIPDGKLFMMEDGKDYQAIWGHWCDLNTCTHPSSRLESC